MMVTVEQRGDEQLTSQAKLNKKNTVREIWKVGLGIIERENDSKILGVL